jgi:hypothetical protein
VRTARLPYGAIQARPDLNELIDSAVRRSALWLAHALMANHIPRLRTASAVAALSSDSEAVCLLQRPQERSCSPIARKGGGGLSRRQMDQPRSARQALCGSELTPIVEIFDTNY